MIRYLTFEAYHGKSGIGSTRIRVHNLIKYWPEAGLYKYGENPDALIFQKVYMNYDYQFPKHFEGIRILDICDPDWTEGLAVAETVRNMDGVTVPTEELAEFIRQFADCPVKVIPDRHDLETFPPLKTHKGKLTRAVWFGYAHNAEVLRFVIPVLERFGIALTIISNDNPYADRWGSQEFDYTYMHYNQETIHTDLQAFDICILPKGDRPRDRFKSNNKTVIAQLCGLPVVTNVDELEAMLTAEARQEEAQACYNEAIKDYDCKLSVVEMKGFIDGLRGR